MKNKFKVSSIAQFIDMDGLSGDEIVERKGMIIDGMSIDPNEEHTIIAKISSNSIDADGDIIIPEGCDFKRYMKNGVILVDHDYKVESIVGKALSIEVKESGIYAKIKFADTIKANDVWQLVKGSYLKANSIGFIIKNAILKGTKEFKEYVNTHKLLIDNSLQRIITDFELIENSLVAVPSNPEALITAISTKSIELSDKTIKDLGLYDSKDNSPNTPIKDIAEIKEYIKELKEYIFKGVEKDTNKANEEIVGIKEIEPEPIKETKDNIVPINSNVSDIKDNIVPIEIKEANKNELPVEEPIKEQLADNDIGEVIEEPKEIINIIRLGDYDIEKELKIQKALKEGKIL